jgi:hypothetical protein
VPEILASDSQLNLQRLSISEIKENGKTIPMPQKEAEKVSLPSEFDRRRATGSFA